MNAILAFDCPSHGLRLAVGELRGSAVVGAVRDYRLDWLMRVVHQTRDDALRAFCYGAWCAPRATSVLHCGTAGQLASRTAELMRAEAWQGAWLGAAAIEAHRGRCRP